LRRGCRDVVELDARYLDVQIETVEQRPREARAVVLDTMRRAMAPVRAVAAEPTRAGIHGGDELELGREGHLFVDARDPRDACFERLAQRFESDARKLWQLVEKEHALMSEGDLARPRPAAAAY
jgi:hypothetical protein